MPSGDLSNSKLINHRCMLRGDVEHCASDRVDFKLKFMGGEKWERRREHKNGVSLLGLFLSCKRQFPRGINLSPIR